MPGSASGAAAPQMPNMWPMLLVMVMIMGLYFIDGNQHYIGKFLNYAFQIIDFNGQYPVLTLMLMGAIMIALSSILTAALTDTITQAKNQQFSSAFQKELRQARMDNNMYKMKKLTEMQDVMMQKSMESSNQMMKTMPLTMLIVIPIFLWVRYFVDVTLREAGNLVINIPWAMIVDGGVDLTTVYWFMPAWILVYSLISIPLGQLINRLVRTYKFKKRLAEIEGTSA